MGKIQLTLLLALVVTVIGAALEGYPMWTHFAVLVAILAYLIAKLFGMRGRE